MDEKRRVRVSKFLSKHLRHSPEGIGLTLEPGGWAPIADVLAGCSAAGFALTRDELDEVVRTCSKQRFAVDDTGTRIRANQGHSTDVELTFDPADPPPELYHGTADRNLDSIRQEGLHKGARHHVHLSPDIVTATTVGRRHGSPVVLAVDAARMRAVGFVFYRAANGVWLVDHVPPQYLRAL